jgi:tRNA dimethylallyltransferase
LNIGTGKVTKKEMAGIPHHLLDVAIPKKQFSADDFLQLGTAAISDILENKRMPIIVGGTGFYVDALLGRIVLPGVAPNIVLRKQLDKKSVTELFAMLKKLDPRRAATIEQRQSTAVWYAPSR